MLKWWRWELAVTQIKHDDGTFSGLDGRDACARMEGKTVTTMQGRPTESPCVCEELGVFRLPWVCLI